MSGFKVLHILELADDVGHKTVDKMISNFSCKKNLEVENFLHENALDFARKRLASTYLVFANTDGGFVFVGYFSLTHKYFQVDEEKLHALSNTLRTCLVTFFNVLK